LQDRSDDGPLRVFVEDPGQYLKFDPSAPQVAGLLSGRVMDAGGHQAAATLAIAVNGKVRATTITYRPESSGGTGVWTAFVPPRHFRPGPNEVEVFVVRQETGGVRLERAYSSSKRPATLNLASRGARDYWSVTQTGFHDREGSANTYRWTNGDATIALPRNLTAPPKSLRIGLARAPAGTPLTVAVNGCTVYSGPVDDAPWWRTFALGQCRDAVMQGTETRITLKNPAIKEKPPGRRMLGVAVETVNLFDQPWPVSSADPAKTVAMAEPVEPVKQPVAAGSTVEIELANRGESVWLGPMEGTSSRDRVDIALRWRRQHGPGQSVEQRMALPHTFYPEDREVITVPVVVPEALRNGAPLELTIAPVFQDGRPIKVEPRLTLEVVQ
jgi:hypothetical protein